MIDPTRLRGPVAELLLDGEMPPPIRGGPRALSENSAVVRSSKNNESEWPTLIPLTDYRLPPFPDLFPGFLGDMVSATSRWAETPIELAAMNGLAVAAASIAGKIEVSPETGYIEPLNVYTVAALPSGNRKTSVLQKMAEPLLAWERREAARIKPQIDRLKSQRKTIEARIERMRKNAAESGDLAEDDKEIAKLEATLPDIPSLPRLWTQDITPERLAGIMAEQGEKIALISDEGGIFDTLAGRYSNGVPNLDVFLQAHAGSKVRVDRSDKSKTPIQLERPLLTVCLSPQPDVLQALSKKPDFRGRGLLARFLYALPNSPLGYRLLEPNPIPGNVETAYDEGISKLLDIDPSRTSSGKVNRLVLRFEASGYSSWKDFQRTIENQLREGERLERIRDWASKLPGGVARVAGILQCVSYPTDPPITIERDIIERALEFGAILTNHALAVFGLMERDFETTDALRILRWIKRVRQTSFTIRCGIRGM